MKFFFSSLTAIVIVCVFPNIVFSQTSDRATNSLTVQPDPNFREKSCSQNIETLTTELLKDIPDYSNRVIQRTQNRHQDMGIYNYVIFAGRGETQPLNLPKIDYSSNVVDATEQIFFTTFERQYVNQQKLERETYHWLFVTLAESGWHLVTMFSRFGNETKNTPPTPPQESSNGIIGQAVSLWLRDCRA